MYSSCVFIAAFIHEPRKICGTSVKIIQLNEYGCRDAPCDPRCFAWCIPTSIFIQLNDFYTCICVELVGQVVKAVNLEVAGSSPHQPPPAPTSPPSCNGYLEYSRVQVHLTLSHASAMAQVGLRVPTLFAERRSQASCEFLARLQEFALHWL